MRVVVYNVYCTKLHLIKGLVLLAHFKWWDGCQVARLTSRRILASCIYYIHLVAAELTEHKVCISHYLFLLPNKQNTFNKNLPQNTEQLICIRESNTKLGPLSAPSCQGNHSEI